MGSPRTPSIGAGLLPSLPLHTPRLELRLFRLEDAGALYELHRNARVTRHAGGSRTKEESSRSLKRIIARTTTTGFGALAVSERGQEAPIGWCGVQSLKNDERYEILYALRPDKWGQGLATEAAASLMLAAFELRHLGIKNICAVAYPQNVQSLTVIQRLGMTFERNIYDAETRRYACVYSIERSTFLRHYARLQLAYPFSSK